MKHTCRGTSRDRATIEALEPRLLLSGGLLITELMADNDTGLLDGDGNTSDWLEIHNPTDAAVTLDGWYLTDDDDDLTQWEFPNPTGAPDTVIDPGGYLVVFASNGREDADDVVDPNVDPAGNWHTNFNLSKGGEYLALAVDDNGQPVVVHAYDPEFPEQLSDVSYGLPDTTIVCEQLVAPEAPVAYHVPTAADADLLPDPGVDAGWTALEFDDSTWTDTIVVDPAGLLITEVGTGDVRFVEIQNVAAGGINAAGWQVLVNDASSGINAVHAEGWALGGGTIAAGTVLYGTDDAGDAGADYTWSASIDWAIEGSGWVMLIDDAGAVMDFAAWGYTAGQIASMDISFGGFASITVGGQWAGDGADVGALSSGAGGFTAFNDHVAGVGTHANATTYAANGAGSGSLKDIDTGDDTAATLTTTHSGVSFANNGAAPAAGTDAHTIFDGFVDFVGASGSSLEIIAATGDRYTHTFTGLDTGSVVTYTFAGTAIRGDGGYAGRWTLVTLEGADGFSDAHSTGNGVVAHDPEDPTPPVAANQVAIWTGYNSASGQGFVAAWTDIDPGPDGVFSVISRQYTGPTPGVGSGTAGGDKGYGLVGVRLEEVGPLGPTAFLQRTGDRDGDMAGDFARSAAASPGQQNGDMTVPFGTTLPTQTGIGFSADQIEFDQIIRTDVGAETQGVNASLWTRIAFQADTAQTFDTLTLSMKYDDGFVAYINGTEVARRNAPTTLAYNAAATEAHPNAQAVVFEDIDISEYLWTLAEGVVNVLAIHALNVGVSDADLLILPELTAVSNAPGPQYMTTPTPGAANIPGALGMVADTTFSVDRGFYSDPFDVEITTATPGADVYYTLDGSEPTDLTGTPYTAPIHVAGQTVLRAAAFKPGWIPSNVDTQSYIFISDVIRQDYQTALDAGFPTTWNTTSPDYGMDPDVIGTFDEFGNPNGDDNYAGLYAATIADDLMSLPTMSIVMDINDLFGSSGIYSYPQAGGVAWERPASVELIYPDATEGFQVNSGIRIQGGYFRTPSSKKHSFRLVFKDEYGPARLEFPLFDDPGAVESFDTIVLRAGANDGYTWGAAKYTEQFIRDEFGRSLQLAIGQPSPHGNFVHLYVNGMYWGLYNPVERPDDAFSASYFGGDKDDWDAIHVSETNAGTRDAWNQMLSQSAAAGSSNDEYMELQGRNPDGTPNPAYPNLLDVEAYIDYLLVNVWGGNWDWPWKNWWAGRDSTDASTGFKFYDWDFENTMGNNLARSPLSKNALNNSFTGSSNAGQAHTSLTKNDEYKLLFADRAHRALYNQGVLTPDSLIERYTELADTVEQAIVAESARWGDIFHNPPMTQANWYDADTNYSDGHAGLGWILNYYLPLRTEVVKGQLIGKGLYPNLAAAVFEIDGTYRHGGEIAAGAQFSMQDMQDPDGKVIYYTLDGTDPREFGGAIVGTQYTPGQTIPLTASTRVRARVLSGGTWSALNDATFYVNAPAAGELTVTELNYHPHDPTAEELAIDPAFTPGDFEFVELLNTTDHGVNLLGVKFADGVTFEFTPAAPVTLAPGQYGVLVANTAAFEARYGTGANVVGVFTGALENAGEDVALTHPLAPRFEAFEYGDSGNWPNRADGSGSTLEIVDPAGDHADPDSWRSSSEYGGSPGTAGAGPRSDVVVNEVLTHTDDPQVDTIELHNTTGGDIDVGGWFLSDANDDYSKFRIPDDTTIGAGLYVTFDEHDFNVTGLDENPANDDPKDFALSSAFGDDVWLLQADPAGKLTHFVDHLEFGAAANGESFGRWPNGTGKPYPMAELTFGSVNTGPRVGPVVVSEIHYHPENPDGPGGVDADDLEFIELYNPTGQTVNLWETYFVDGVWRDYHWTVEGFSFATGTALAPRERLVVVPFDPDTEPAKLADFEGHYGITGQGVRIVGPYDGQLNNAGETVRFKRPDEPPPEDVEFTPTVLVDEVIYDDLPPWPTEPDTDSMSLNRLSARAWGNDPASWVALAPTPGASHDTEAPTLDAWFSAADHDGGERLLQVPDDGSFSEPRDAGIKTLVLQFSEAVDLAGASVALAGINQDGEMVLTGIAADVSTRAPDRVQIVFDDPLPDVARHLVRLDGVADLADNALADDNDRIMTALLGDTDGNLKTDVADLLNAWTHRGRAADAGTDPTRSDVNRSATVDTADMLLAWDHSGADTTGFADPVLQAPAQAQGQSPQAPSQSKSDPQAPSQSKSDPQAPSQSQSDPQAQGSQSLGSFVSFENPRGFVSPGLGVFIATQDSGATADPVAPDEPPQLEPDLSSGLTDPLTGEAV